jgi:uncharacterized protein (DUF697 family)
MAGMRDLASVWKNIREVDLRPIRESALRPVRIVLVGSPGSGRHTLAARLRVDPSKPGVQLPTPIKILHVNEVEEIPQAELFVIMLDASRPGYQKEEQLAHRLSRGDRKVIVFINKIDLVGEGQLIQTLIDWPVDRLVYGSAVSASTLESQFVPAVMELLPDYLLALGRTYPLFRTIIANHLINDTSFSNAAYALSTGIAEIFPGLGIPLNIADMVVLTKAQAFLVYRLGLTLGFSTEWRDYVGEFGSVVGSGFIWRQMARQLVGLVPVWGIVPKVGVSYAGTYVVGHTVLRWYLTGKHLTPQQMRELYRQAFALGKQVARRAIEKAPRPRLRLGRRRQAQLPPPPEKVCPNCGKPNAPDAHYCQYCGLDIAPELPPPSGEA